MHDAWGLMVISRFHPAYAGLEQIPFPAPVNKRTGAIQPFSSRNASLAGWMRIYSRPGTFKICKWRPNFRLHLLASLYLPSGMQETPACLFFQVSSMLYNFFNKSFGGSEMVSNQIPRFVNRNYKKPACGDLTGRNCNSGAIKANLFCRTSAERVRNECGTSAEGEIWKR